MTTPKHARITGEKAELMRAEMRRLYDAGMSIRDIAEEYHRSYGTVNRMLREAGAELRTRGGLAGRIRRDKEAGAKPLTREETLEYRQRLAARQ